MASRSSVFLVASMLLAIGFAGSASARCLSYEPARVTLTGKVEMRKLPGPPNYRSVARGDRPENVYFLKLDQKACVSASPTSRLNSKAHAGIEEMQLIISAVEGSAAVGKHLRITGTLSGAQGGQHRTPVLLTVKESRQID